MRAEIAVQFEPTTGERRGNLRIVEVPVAPNGDRIRHEMQNVIEHGCDIIAMRGASREIGMNPQFHAPLPRGLAYGSTCVRDEERRFDRKPTGDFEEMLDAVFGCPIQIRGQGEIHWSPCGT